MYSALEKVVSLEDTFEEQQKPLIELEKEENDLYEEIISLGMKEYDKIVSLSKEAAAVVEEREKRLEDERQSILDSKEEFKNIAALSNELKEDGAKDKADKLQGLMQNRYDSYDALYASYKEAIVLDKELYQMFQKKDLKLEELEAKITEINSTYEKVLAENKKFNDYTEQYNQAKMDFYKEAEIEVEQPEENASKS
ncbi:YkyA family protein [Metabacillus dongyingensis]|nr:YkyA family protein [Metabacillus dongyingensis]